MKYGERANPVIPLPFDLGSSRGEKAKGGYELYLEARSDATRFFTLAGANPTARLLTLDPALAPKAPLLYLDRAVGSTTPWM